MPLLPFVDPGSALRERRDSPRPPASQGQCGSCWSFTTHTAWANQICLRSDDPAYRADQSSCNQCAGAVAAIHPPCAGKGASDELDDQKLYTCPGALSTQYQLDCNKKADNCHGGTLQEAWKFTMTTGGVSEASYRYGQYSSADNTAQARPSARPPCLETRW